MSLTDERYDATTQWQHHNAPGDVAPLFLAQKGLEHFITRARQADTFGRKGSHRHSTCLSLWHRNWPGQAISPSLVRQFARIQHRRWVLTLSQSYRPKIRRGRFKTSSTLELDQRQKTNLRPPPRTHAGGATIGILAGSQKIFAVGGKQKLWGVTLAIALSTQLHITMTIQRLTYPVAVLL